MSYTQYCERPLEREGSLRKDQCSSEATALYDDGKYYCDGHLPLEEGQRVLLNDVKALLQEIREGEFGDFSNEKYPAPKIALRGKFAELADNVINGKYD